MSSHNLGKRKREGPDGHVFTGRNFISGNSQLQQGDVYHITNGSDLTDEQKCVQALYTGKSYQKYKDINPLRADGTCLWVLENPRFIKWRDDVTESLLWVSADPGCGKSVLSRSLIDRDLCRGDRTICFFFFKDNGDQNNLNEALCALLHQLFTSKPVLVQHAMPDFRRYGEGIRQEVRLMWSILLSAIRDVNAGEVVVVLDALDECHDTDRRDLITRLCTFREPVSGHPACSKAKFLITSRPYDSVQRWFHDTVMSFPQIRLRGEDENEQLNKEIDIVIEYRVVKLSKEFDLSHAHQQALMHKLTGMQHRTYLWLRLAMEEIREAYKLSLTPDEVKVQSLSRDINEAYETILRKISKGVQEKNARMVLTVILGARRPLNLEEMASALSAYMAYENSSAKLPEVQASRLRNLIREWCGLFVFMQDSRIFLIHQTAREFLLSSTQHHVSSNAAGWQHSFGVTSLAQTLAHVIMTYLDLVPRQSLLELLRKTPRHALTKPTVTGCDKLHANGFLQYCLDAWPSGLTDHNLYTDPKLVQRFLDLRHPSRCNLSALYQTHYLRCKYGMPTLNDDGDTVYSETPLRWRQELLSALRSKAKYISNGMDQFTWQTLSVAAAHGFVEIVEWLLTEDVLIDAVDEDDYTALMYAAGNGHLSIVELLLEAGARIRIRCPGRSNTALSLAASEGHVQIVRLILQKGKETGISVMANYEAFSRATGRGHIEVLEVFLQNDPAVEYLDLALGTAIYYGQLKTLQWLLERGASIEATNSVGQTPLLLATGHNRVEMMELLIINAGADMNAKDSLGNTSLHLAVTTCSLEAVKVLVDAGADMEILDRDGNTALQCAKIVETQWKQGWRRAHGNKLKASKIVQLLNHSTT